MRFDNSDWMLYIPNTITSPMPYFFTDDTAYSPGLRVRTAGNSSFVFTKQCLWCWRRMIRSKPSEAIRPNWRFCSFACKQSFCNAVNPYGRRTQSPSERSARSISALGKPNLKLRSAIKGDKHWNWQGGKTREVTSIRNSAQYKDWRRDIFERDNYTCQECGARNGNGFKVILNADHVKPFAYFPEFRFDLCNGRTLCLPCHIKTPTFSWRAKPAPTPPSAS